MALWHFSLILVHSFLERVWNRTSSLYITLYFFAIGDNITTATHNTFHIPTPQTLILMALWHFSLILVHSFLGVDAAVFTLQNRCEGIIWPGILANGGIPQLANGGLQLKPHESVDINAPTGWSGRFWARSECSFDQSGRGSCTTGDCGGILQCDGAGGAPPASLAEFTLDSPLDFYDISLVDGFNMPVSIVPSSGSGNCSESKGRVVACKSACMAFNKSEYCCTGEYNDPKKCKPTNYSEVFKAACPTAYSYAYDDATSIFTCKGANYLIRFC
ncbi:unnamed protein product [Ilex paraguariensis]|uniref:Thaumatin-like protein n=1 Tax=Ilex paraguariensis TaxID=185542 RepID=A0ABC8SD87_9AQUA